MSAAAWLGLAAAVIGVVPQGLRWLRVSQREHYLPGAASRFAQRWWRSSALNVLLVAVGLAAAGVAFVHPAAACFTALVALLGPVGLTVRGRTSPLAWTRRLKTLAIVTGVLVVVVLLVGVLAHVAAAIAALVALGMPLVIDAAARIVAPVERRMGDRFIEQATERLRSVHPTVVGITGSYGKTSTKNHLVGLLGTDRAVVPSPRSFNNRAGLARAINEQLAPGTDVFIAEMGTYGPGEIADMVAWCPPAIAVLTAIGPVHLERFGSLDVTLAAKAEITTSARVVIVNADDQRLAGLAAALDATHQVRRASASVSDLDVGVVPGAQGWSIFVDGALIASVPVPPGVQPSNAACALAAALVLGVDPKVAAARVGQLHAVENRQSVVRAPSGVLVIDDTFNANPAGAKAALDLLASQQAEGRRVVVTPGMIELGPRQREENQIFARRAAEVADVVVVVGHTNARSLLAGATAPGVEVIRVRTRDEAVAWVRSQLGSGDAVLYENDLPDHYS
jgi:UDP-N-acetylmuramoyl-tripeptide--D-alanyl-D-alanine ligase